MGQWKVLEDRTTEGIRSNNTIVMETVQYYKGMKKEKGYMRPVPFRCRDTSCLIESRQLQSKKMSSIMSMKWGCIVG